MCGLDDGMEWNREVALAVARTFACVRACVCVSAMCCTPNWYFASECMYVSMLLFCYLELQVVILESFTTIALRGVYFTSRFLMLFLSGSYPSSVFVANPKKLFIPRGA